MLRRTVALSAALAACSAGTEPIDVPAGTLRFAYQGEIVGSFDVTGPYPRPGEDCVACAYARPSVQGDLLLLSGSRDRDGLRDILTVTIAYPTRAGPYALELPTDFAYGVPWVGLPQHVFSFTSGEVVVTELDDTRLRGELSGVGVDFDLAASPPDTLWVEITGSFDLPILPR